MLEVLNEISVQISEMEKKEADLKAKLQTCLQEKADVEFSLEKDQKTLNDKQNSLKQMDQRIKVCSFAGFRIFVFHKRKLNSLQLLEDQMASYQTRMKKTEAEWKTAEPDPAETKRIETAIKTLTKGNRKR